MKISNLFSAFQIFFYPGSQIRESMYKPLMHQIHSDLQSKNINHTLHYVPRSFWKKNTIPKNNETVFIGHSLGGYFAIKDALETKPSGLILLNSHFNSRFKAPYPKISQKNIQCPTLVILASQDKRLPLKIAMDDFFEKIKYHLFPIFYINNKSYTHFSGISEQKTNETIRIANQITDFLMDISNKNFSTTELSALQFDSKIYDIVPRSIVLSESVCLYDALLKIIIDESIWDLVHWYLFLFSRPDSSRNYIFESENHIYLKTFNTSASYLESYIKLFHDNVKTQYITLPSIHLGIFLWLFMPLFAHKQSMNKVNYSILEYPIKNNVTYYKIPHPKKLFLYQQE